MGLSLLLGAAGAADVLVPSQRERAGDLAVLRATGWTSRDFARLTAYEGIAPALPRTCSPRSGRRPLWHAGAPP